VIFHSYVSLPEGICVSLEQWLLKPMAHGLLIGVNP